MQNTSVVFNANLFFQRNNGSTIRFMSFRDIHNENSLNGILFTKQIVFDHNNLTCYGIIYLKKNILINFKRYKLQLHGVF